MTAKRDDGASSYQSSVRRLTSGNDRPLDTSRSSSAWQENISSLPCDSNSKSGSRRVVVYVFLLSSQQCVQLFLDVDVTSTTSVSLIHQLLLLILCVPTSQKNQSFQFIPPFYCLQLIYCSCISQRFTKHSRNTRWEDNISRLSTSLPH